MNRPPYSRLSEYYDIGWGDFAESSQSFIETTLAQEGIVSGSILELACGTGILATHLSRLGYEVVGLDRSPEMVALANQRARYETGISFRVADMRAPQVNQRFGAVLCMFDSLNYLTEISDVADTFGAVSGVLKAHGVFIFDFNRPLIYSAHNGETIKMRTEDGLLLQELHYEPKCRIGRTVFRFPDGDVETHNQRAYTLDEIRPLLDAAGLRLRECYSDFTRRPVSSLSERLICVCQNGST